MFKPQFAPLVKSGAKRQTIRPTPKRMPKAGELESWREWSGKPYRSRTTELAKVSLVYVTDISMEDTGREMIVSFPHRSLPPEEINQIACDDGFRDAIEMFDWFENTHGLPFKGIIIMAKDADKSIPE